MCIQKLFILIKMMYSVIKQMVLCIAYHFRRVNALEAGTTRTLPPVQLGTGQPPAVALAVLCAECGL